MIIFCRNNVDVVCHFDRRIPLILFDVLEVNSNTQNTRNTPSRYSQSDMLLSFAVL